MKHRFCCTSIAYIFMTFKQLILILLKNFRFLPNISETQINPDQVSFKPDVKRATIFQGMKFIFLSAKQVIQMSNMSIPKQWLITLLYPETICLYPRCDFYVWRHVHVWVVILLCLFYNLTTYYKILQKLMPYLFCKELFLLFLWI